MLKLGKCVAWIRGKANMQYKEMVHLSSTRWTGEQKTNWKQQNISHKFLQYATHLRQSHVPSGFNSSTVQTGSTVSQPIAQLG